MSDESKTHRQDFFNFDLGRFSGQGKAGLPLIDSMIPRKRGSSIVFLRPRNQAVV